MQIFETIDYNQFNEIASNRDVDRKHVNKLVSAIRSKNLLALNPIIVNDKMEVVDGQHRLAAAKQLKTPIFYVVSDSINHDDIAKLNSNKMNWKLMDYINYYTVKGIKEYKELSKLINEYPHLPLSFLIALLSDDGKRHSDDVLRGHLDITNLPEARETIKYIEGYVPYFAHAYNSRFLEAFLYICSTGLYNHEVMLAKLQRNPGALIPCANKKQYIKLLQEIFNKGTHEKNIALFTKR